MYLVQLRHDVRQAWRQIAAHPGYTLVIVLTLALGIGANTAIFSVARGVLLRPLPYAQGDALVHMVARIPGAATDQLYFPVQELLDYRRATLTLAGLDEYHSMPFSLLGIAEPDRVQTGVISAGFFHTLGVAPLFGRDLRPDDERPGADPVLLLTYDYWRERFGGDPGIVGRRLRMNERPILVVGVLPRLPAYPGKDRIFMPTSACPFRAAESTKSDRSARLLDLWGRLRPGVKLAQAQAEIATISARIARQFPSPDMNGVAVSLVPVREELVGAFRPTLFVLLGTSGLVLLIACANAANLTFTRLLGREREVVVRAALGASRARLIRQLLTENVLTALLGGVLGSLLAWSGLGVLVAFAGRFTPRAAEIRIDGLVLLFSLALSLAAGLLSGWVPVARALRGDLAAGLRAASGRGTASGGSHHFRDLMVATQVGVSFVLLIGAGLMVRSLVQLLRVEPGIRPERVLTAKVSLSATRYAAPAQAQQFFTRLLADLAADPAVAPAALSSDVPMTSDEPITPALRVAGQPLVPGQPLPHVDLHVASENYFQVLGIPLLAGRTFRPADGTRAPLVAVVNREAARRFWPGRDPLGQRLSIDAPEKPKWRTVVGVVGNVRQEGLTAPPRPALYAPYLQMDGAGVQIFLRARAAPAVAFARLRAAVHAIDRDQPVAEMETLEQVRGEALAPTRLTTSLLALFAGLALATTALGIAAAVSFAVAQRVPEMAIRMAVGADGGRLLRLLLRRALTPVAAGLGGGLAAAIALTRLLGGLLYDVRPLDPLTLAAALLALSAIGLLTSLLPARRATRLDPAAVLRS